MTRGLGFLLLAGVLLLVAVGVRDEAASSSGRAGLVARASAGGFSFHAPRRDRVVAVSAARSSRPVHHWQPAYVTAYATFENLTGCTSPGRCQMACGGLLNDGLFTVASSLDLGLPCGARIRLCVGWPHWSHCHDATVTDRTLSRFHFELSYSLALATGASARGWDSPRRLIWARLS